MADQKAIRGLYSILNMYATSKVYFQQHEQFVYYNMNRTKDQKCNFTDYIIMSTFKITTTCLRRPPPYIPIGLRKDCSNDTRFVSLVEMSFTDPHGDLNRAPVGYIFQSCSLSLFSVDFMWFPYRIQLVTEPVWRASPFTSSISQDLQRNHINELRCVEGKKPGTGFQGSAEQVLVCQLFPTCLITHLCPVLRGRSHEINQLSICS